MKKVFFYIVLCLMLGNISAQAQLKFGIKGGYTISPMESSEELLNFSNRTGYFIGSSASLELPLPGLGIDASALYMQTSTDIKVKKLSLVNDITFKQIVVPLNLRYGIGLGSTASAFVFAGPQVAFAIGNKTKDLQEKIASWTMNSSEFSINIGAGVRLMQHLQLSVGYNIPCGNTGDITKGKVLDKLTHHNHSIKNNSWQVAAAFYF